MCHGSSLELYLDLGLTPPADEFRESEKAAHLPQVSYPLEVVLCMACGQSQLSTVVAPEVLYQNDYPYESSTTAAGRKHFATFARSVVADYEVRPEELVVDVGSNVGVLVRGFTDAGTRGLGIEPASNIAAIANNNGVETISEFFSVDVARSVLSSHGKARIITATNVFAHVDDLDSFMSAADVMLTQDGLLIIEAPHFLQLVRSLEYDTIYHEHLSYLAVTPLEGFLIRHGFELVDVIQVGIHGGSFRLFVGRRGQYTASRRVAEMRHIEGDERICELDRLQHFSSAVARHRIELMTLLYDLKRAGRSIAGVSAPAKGMTLINYCGIGPGILEFVTEKSTLKVGRYTPGGRIPVVPDASLTERGIDYGLLLAWNFADEIMANLAGFKAAGGRFIIPIPHPTVV
jgi:hypothetical protein